jgi:hypothetical protein
VATKKRTSVLLDRSLLKRARKALRAANNTQAIEQALTEAVTNRKIDTTLSVLLRKRARALRGCLSVALIAHPPRRLGADLQPEGF